MRVTAVFSDRKRWTDSLFEPRATNNETTQNGAGEPDTVIGYGWEVEVFNCMVKKGEGGSVDTLTKRCTQFGGYCVGGKDGIWSGLSKAHRLE